MATTFSNPMATPMGCVLGDIAGIKSADERDWLFNTLVTAAEFYCRGRDVGYAEGLKANKSKGEGK